jgi:hypothetical protein
MKVVYPLLDSSPAGRIIKDVMRHQLGEGKEPKKEHKQKTEAGFEAWKLWQEAVDETDIDPAEFFDPEEFGIRRRFTNDA